jgi:acyl-CoA thioester hydrolase
MPGGFVRDFTAAPDDIDELGHVNNAVWVRWVQTLATDHWHALADPADSAACIWVVIRHEIDYLRPLLVGQTAHGRTWVPDAPRGARFDRHVEFTSADAKPLVRARTTWAMIDRATGRPLRVPADLVARFRSF